MLKSVNYTTDKVVGSLMCRSVLNAKIKILI